MSCVNWWMTRTDRTLSEEIPALPADVRAFYTDLDNLRLVHPFVTSVRTVCRSETAVGYVQTYRVGDRIPVGPVTLRLNYIARLSVPVAGDVLTEARQFPRVRLTGRVAFEPIDIGTRIVEQMRIEAPRPLAPMTIRKAVEAHASMLACIRRRFEQVA